MGIERTDESPVEDKKKPGIGAVISGAITSLRSSVSGVFGRKKSTPTEQQAPEEEVLSEDQAVMTIMSALGLKKGDPRINQRDIRNLLQVVGGNIVEGGDTTELIKKAADEMLTPDQKRELSRTGNAELAQRVEDIDLSNPIDSTQNTPKKNERVKTIKNEKDRIGRNELCPCGSGKKFKNCHSKKE